MDKRFLKAEILKKGVAYIASIYYSYYSIYNFKETEIFDKLEDAKDWILKERCQNMLYISE